MKRLALVGILPVAVIFLVAVLPLVDAEACTSMFWNTNGQVMLVGRNMDLDLDDQPILYVFPEGISKDGGVANPAAWTSQYGSLVVTNLGHSTVSAEGINTAGLCFHSQWLSPTQFEDRDGRPGVLQGRYGMYLLDNCATVGEALALMYQTQLVPEEVDGKKFPQHYALEDALGNRVIVEFIAKQMKVYYGAEYNVLTNDPPFDQQITNLWHYQYFGGEQPLPGDCNPTARFVRASAFLSTLNGSSSYAAIKTNPISTMFLAIRSMSEPFGALQFIPGVSAPIAAWPTLWTIVSDLTNKAVYFNHNIARNNFWIDMKKLNFSPGASVRSLKADRPDLVGEVSGLFAPTITAIQWLLLSE